MLLVVFVWCGLFYLLVDGFLSLSLRALCFVYCFVLLVFNSIRSLICSFVFCITIRIDDVGFCDYF